MKAGKKTFLAGILAVVMIASSSITVLAAEASQTPQENLQSITQQDEQTTEKKVRKNKTATDSENTQESNFKKYGHYKKDMTSEDGTEEVKKPKRHVKDKSTEDAQTAEDGTETSKRRLHKKISQILMKIQNRLQIHKKSTEFITGFRRFSL